MNYNNKVLVTGGAGFIGSHLCDKLLEYGYVVRVLDNLSFGHREWLSPEVEFIEGDVEDLDTCRIACKGIEGVFHLAAMARVGPSAELLDAYTRQNVIGTQNILLAARDSGASKVIYSASSTYYGNRSGPQREDMEPEFLNFYALSKAIGEQYCLTFDRVFDVPTIRLRYFNVYGARQPQFGPYALVLGIFLRQRQAKKPLEIHGTGSQRRDFVHVSDAVAANLKAFQSVHRAEVFNVGSGSNISIKELADLISPYQILSSRRAGDAETTLADISNIRKTLGWEPKIKVLDGLNELMIENDLKIECHVE